MSWVRRSNPSEHRCAVPSGSFGGADGRRGDLWRCDECRRLWRVDTACDACFVLRTDQPHAGQHQVGLTWRFASAWERFRYRRRP
jgi:hypothetical protein